MAMQLVWLNGHEAVANHRKKRPYLNIVLSHSFMAGLLFAVASHAEPISDALFNLSLIELSNIEVTSATKHPQALKDIPATIYIYTEQDFAKYGFRDLKDVLKFTAGVEYGDAHSWLQGGQRGFTGTWSHTRILIDGRDADKIIRNQAHISHQYPLYNIKQVEIIQGPASSLYGADVFAGLINLVTKTADNTETGQHVSVTLGEGEDELSSQQVTYSNIYKKDQLAVSFHSSWLNLKDPNYTSFVLSEEYSFTNQDLRERFFNEGNPYEDDNRGLDLNVIVDLELQSGDEIEIGADHRESRDGGGIENPELIYSHFKETINQTRLFFNYKKNELAGGKLSFDYQLLQEDVIYDFNLRNLDDGDPPPLVQYAQHNNDLHKAVLQYDRNFKDYQNYLIVGYSYKDLDQAKPVFGDRNYDHLNPFLNHKLRSVFVQDQQTLLDGGVFLTLGFHYDNSNLYDDVETLRGAVQYNFNSDYSLKVLYGEAFREPTTSELSKNDQLDPADVETTEIVFDGRPNQFVNYKLASYSSRARNIIGENRQDTDGPIINIDKKNIDGSEASLRWHYHSLSGFLWGSYLEVGDHLDLAEYKFGLGISKAFSNSWVMSAVGKYSDEIPTQAKDADGNTYIETVPEYYVMDVTLLGNNLVNWQYNKVELSLSIHNIFDRKNYYPNPRGPDPIKFLAQERSYFIKTRFSF
jgi:outer membrane cobalamin receptor